MGNVLSPGLGASSLVLVSVWPCVSNPSRCCVCSLDSPAFLRTCCSLTRWQSCLPPLFILTCFAMHRASLQISLRLQKGKEKITCKHKDMHANTLFMCFSHAACACRHLCMLIYTHMHFLDTCIPLDENPRVENVSISIRELFRAFDLKQHLVAAFQC